MHHRTFFATVAFTSLVGCTSLKVVHVQSAYQKPSNVAVYFRIADGDEPVAGLTADRFTIYEDDGLVSASESKQSIINPELAASHYTLLLVDMSGSVTESDDRGSVVEAARVFTARVETNNKVAIYAFDGAPELHPITPFTSSAKGADARAGSLDTFAPKDPSTNLNGAVVLALGELDAALAEAETPLRFGSLVIFTDGTDRAARVTADAMHEAIGDSPHAVFAIGLGSEIDDKVLSKLGRNGTAKAHDRQAVVTAFETIAKKIEGITKSYYLLSYCSPARAGHHEVRIEASVPPAEGKKKERKGQLETQFDATGFEPECDPNTPPSFDLTSGDPSLQGEGGAKASGSANGGAKIEAGAKVEGEAGGSGSKKPRSPGSGG